MGRRKKNRTPSGGFFKIVNFASTKAYFWNQDTAKMYTYRFKLTFEEQSEFLREFELSAEQSFEDFHYAIVENLSLDKNTLASFYLTDNRFRKRREISLVDMSPEDKDSSIDDESQDSMLIMKDAIISDVIDDPHQKLLYVYDYLHYWTFYLELIKIGKASSAHKYPRIAKSLGEVPKELTMKAHQLSSPDLGMELGFEDDLIDPEDLHAFEDPDFLDEEGGDYEEFEDERP